MPSRALRAHRSSQDTRAGHYTRNLETKAGTVKLKVPKLRTLTFETALSNDTVGARVPRRRSADRDVILRASLTAPLQGDQHQRT